MNVFMLLSKPWSYGGCETHVFSLITGLRDRGHEVVICFEGKKKQPQLDGVGATQYPLRFRTPNPFALRKTREQLRNIVRDHAIDVIHAHTRTGCFWGSRLNNEFGVPYTVTLHCLWSRLYSRVMQPFLPETMISVSLGIRDYFNQTYHVPRERIVIIHNGVDTARLQKESKPKPRDDERVRLAYISRLNEDKGKLAITLLKAMEELFVSIPISLSIAGDGCKFEDVKTVAQRLNERCGQECVTMLGRCGDIPRLLQDVDIVIGTGRAAAEAMAAGKPVVAIASEEKFMGLVTPRNARAMHERNFAGSGKRLSAETFVNELLPVLRNPAYREALGSFSARFAVDVMSNDRMVEKVLSLYETLIADGKSGANPRHPT